MAKTFRRMLIVYRDSEYPKSLFITVNERSQYRLYYKNGKDVIPFGSTPDMTEAITILTSKRKEIYGGE